MCEVGMGRIQRSLFVIGLTLLVGLAGAGRVLAQESDDVISRGARDQCWTTLYGLPPGHVRAAQELLRPSLPVVGYELRVPYSLARVTFAERGPVRLSPEVAARYEVPLWRSKTVDWAASVDVPFVLTHGVNACLPYPVRSVSGAPMSIVRGQTLALAIETDRLVFCRYSIFGKTERCYRDGDTGLTLFVGVSALVEPGEYPLQIELVSGGEEVVLSLPLAVTPGRYGFQYIDPPATLSQLMDADLMAAEAAHLAQWRELRSPIRYWDLPLSLPLATAVPISADYGDRRSYGGMVDGYHSGVDYRAWGGMDVIAPANGVVVMADSLAMRGNAVLIDHGWGLVTGYWHLSRIDVQVGDRVSRGQPFAKVGSTGLSTGSHLHWEVWANGVSVDGKQWLSADRFVGMVLDPTEPWPSTTGLQ